MAKNAVFQMTIENAMQDIMFRTGADNVIVDSINNITLAQKLATIAANIEDCMTSDEVDAKISDAIDALIDGAPGIYDTLKEIADYIAEDQTAATAINTALAGKVDKVDAKGLSTNDFTSALLTKLNGIATGANKVEQSATNGNIKINGTETLVYAHPTTEGNIHVPSGGAAGQILEYGGSSGTAKWGSPKLFIRNGTSTPDDLSENELFFKIVE